MSTVFIGTYQAIRISLQEQYYSSATLRSVLSSSPRYISLHPHKFLSNNYASFAFGRSQYAPRPAVLLKCPSNRMKWIQTTPSPCSRRSAHPPQTWRGKGKPGGSRSRNTTTSLSRNQFISLFGNSMTRQDGKHLLATLQDHRCKGTLDAKIDFPEKSIAAGLRYLRARYPVDEDAAINARVDKELENEFRLPQANTEQSPYAHSSLEKIRKENQERNEREMASREKQDIPNSSKGTAVATKPRTLRNLVQRSNEVPDWVQKYRVKAQSTEMPEISTLARLFPTGVFTVSIVILSVLFALNYTPPSQQARMFPETPPAAATLLAILGINISVFVLWRIPQMWAFMNKYFICLPLQPRPAQMLFTGFSHQEIPHLVVNMVPMWFVGVRLHDDIGRGSFLALLLAGAVLNSYTTMSTYVLSNILSSSFIGASGIVTCMIGAACVLHEGRYITFPMIPAELTSALNSGIILAILMGIELVGLRKFGLQNTAAVAKYGAATDHLGHFAGYATGIMAGALIRNYDTRWQGLERHRFWDWRSKSTTKSQGQRDIQQEPFERAMTEDRRKNEP